MTLPAKSITPDFTVAVYCVPYASIVDGVRIAVMPAYVMIQGTVVLPPLSTKAMVDWSTGSVKVMLRAAFGGTFWTPSAGLVTDTPGGVESSAGPVIKI